MAEFSMSVEPWGFEFPLSSAADIQFAVTAGVLPQGLLAGGKAGRGVRSPADRLSGERSSETAYHAAPREKTELNATMYGSTTLVTVTPRAVMAVKWIIRLIAAVAMVVVVHAFMIAFEVPRPAAWYLGAVIYAGLVAVLCSRASVIDKIGTYVMFAVVTIVGALTVCPCTHAHFFIAPIAGVGVLGLMHGLKSLVRPRWLPAANANHQSDARETSAQSNLKPKSTPRSP